MISISQKVKRTSAALKMSESKNCCFNTLL
jgi:hypothetical protein